MFSKVLEEKNTYKNSEGVLLKDLTESIFINVNSMGDELCSYYRVSKDMEMRPDKVSTSLYGENKYTEIILKSVEDLSKLKVLIEVNNLDKPNFSAIARELGVDRRTVKKYYDGNITKDRKPKKSKIDDFYDIISSLLSAETNQIFYYKSHLYRYLVREKGLNCSRSAFNYYILKHVINHY